MVSIFNFSECIEKRFSTDIIKKDFFSFVSKKGKKIRSALKIISFEIGHNGSLLGQIQKRKNQRLGCQHQNRRLEERKPPYVGDFGQVYQVGNFRKGA